MQGEGEEEEEGIGKVKRGSVGRMGGRTEAARWHARLAIN